MLSSVRRRRATLRGGEGRKGRAVEAEEEGDDESCKQGMNCLFGIIEMAEECGERREVEGAGEVAIAPMLDVTNTCVGGNWG